MIDLDPVIQDVKREFGMTASGPSSYDRAIGKACAVWAYESFLPLMHEDSDLAKWVRQQIADLEKT